MSESRDRPSRPPCPKCRSGYGDARIVTMKGAARIVLYVCDRCLAEWEVVDESKPHN